MRFATDYKEYANQRKSILDHVEIEVDKNTVAIHDGKGNPNQILINESGLNSPILSSKLPQAREFKRWAITEASPQMAKTTICGESPRQPSSTPSSPPPNYRMAREFKLWVDAIVKHVDGEDKTTVAICNIGSNYKTQEKISIMTDTPKGADPQNEDLLNKTKITIINESGLYTFMLSS